MKKEIRKVTVEKEIYIAYDGTEFDDPDDCEVHEILEKASAINMIDYRGFKTTSIDDCWAVNLRSFVETENFIALCKYCDVSSKGVEGPGMYIYTEGTYGARNDAWTNISTIMEALNGGSND